MNIYLPYVYRVTNKYTNEFYIGMRSANKEIAEKDLGIRYFTSNKKIKENFKDFNIQIIAYFPDWESAFLFENYFIEEEWGNPKLLNKHYQKNISTFSMKGSKRPDLSEINKKLKSKPKEIRKYKCSLCNKEIIKEEFCHHLPKTNYFCDAKCRNVFYLKKTNNIKSNKKPKKQNKIRVAWNKGLSNPVAAENGKKGAKKQSEKVTGRKRKYLPDGRWVWEYP